MRHSGVPGVDWFVDLQAPMQRQAILDPEVKRTGTRFRPGIDDRINLTVAILVGEIHFPLQHTAIDHLVLPDERFPYRGQCAHDVIRAE